jgi:hypothetical protein
MPKAVAAKKSTPAWESPPATPLDEAVWQAWKARGRARERQAREVRIRILNWGAIAALIAVAGLWSQLTSFEMAIRCVLAGAAAGMTFGAFSKRQYAFGVVFALLALLYNPVMPVLSFSGNWPRALVAASAIPFIGSLAWRDLKVAHIE